MTTNNLTVYLKIFGLSVDASGNQDYAGMKINIGTLKKPMEYEEVVAKLNVEALLSYVGLSEYAGKAEIITPEEYFRDYADEDEEDSI